MTLLRTLRLTAVLGLIAVLAGCGSDTERVRTLDVLAMIQGQIGSGRPAPLSQAQIDRAVRGVPGALKFIEVESRGGQALFAQVESNGPYRTFATPRGQSVAFRHGLAVQSRGLGDDLMSSDEDELLALLRQRQRGTANYVMRFLDGENKTLTYRYTCNVLPQGATTYAGGAVRTAVVELEVHCVGPAGPDFVSTFLVDGNGEIVSAHQWFGYMTEYLNYRTLRY